MADTSTDGGVDDGEPSVEVTYTKRRWAPRDDAFGRTMGWIADHPLTSGVIGGGAAVVAAALSAWEGVRTSPSDAATLAALVVVAWALLIYAMRDFFGRQSEKMVLDRYVLRVTPTRLLWCRGEDVLEELSEPEFDIYVLPGGAKAEQLRSIRLVVEGEQDERCVIETELPAERAESHPTLSDETTPDTSLPRAATEDVIDFIESHWAVARG